MKKQFASIELIRVVKELKEQILNGKINKIYVDIDRVHGTKKELFFECHVPNKGKQMLRIILPACVFLTIRKPAMPETPDGYCMYLRKYLHNAKITEIEQIGIERIIRITVEARARQQLTNLKPQTPNLQIQTPNSPLPTSDSKPQTVLYYLYIELFSKGNFILTAHDNTILSPLELQEWSERTIRPKEKYMYPRQKYNAFKMEETDFIKALELSTKDSLVTVLALDFSLGGTYAEELCHRAAVPRETKKVRKLDGKKIFAAFQELKKEIETGPAYIVKQEGKILDVVPCLLTIYKTKELQKKELFLDALDTVISAGIAETKGTQVVTKQEKKITSLNVMIGHQEKQIQFLEEEYEQNKRIGTMIYESYQQLAPILKLLQDAQKTKTWKEVNKVLKDNPLVKQINEQSKEVIVELC